MTCLRSTVYSSPGENTCSTLRKNGSATQHICKKISSCGQRNWTTFWYQTVGAVVSQTRALTGYYTKKKKERYGVLSFELVDPADADSLRQRSHLGLRRSQRKRRRSEPETPPQLMIYQETVEEYAVGAFTFFGRLKKSRTKLQLTLNWLKENHFHEVYQQRCCNNPGNGTHAVMRLIYFRCLIK